MDEVGRWLVEHTSRGVLWVDRGGRIVLANPAACLLFGWPTLEGATLGQLVPDCGALLDRLLHAATSTGSDGGLVEFTAFTAHGGEQPVEATVSACPVGVGLFVSDPSVNQDLQDELMRLASFPEFNPAPVFELDAPNGEVRYANDAASSFVDGVVAHIMATVSLGDIAAAGSVVPVEVVVNGRNLHGVAHGITEWSCVRVYLRDDTERVALVDALHTSSAALEQRVEDRTAALAREVEVRKVAEQRALDASRSKSAFLANMSHELRTPLNAILGYTEMLLEECETDSVQSDLKRIYRAGDHLLALISDILDLAKIEAGRIELVLETTALSALLAEVADLGRPLADAKGLILSLELGALPELCIDAARVRQIVLNLVSNAIKFTERGGVTVRAAQLDDAVLIAVHDSGVGISVENLDRIFEPFQQESAMTSREFGGTGLGLAISRELAVLMGGSVEVTSELGVGSTFTLVLPLVSPPSSGPPPITA